MQVEQPTEQQFAEGAMADEGMEVSSLNHRACPWWDVVCFVLSEGLIGDTPISMHYFIGSPSIPGHWSFTRTWDCSQRHRKASRRRILHCGIRKYELPCFKVPGPDGWNQYRNWSSLAFLPGIYLTDCPCNSSEAVRCERDFGSQGDETQGGKTDRAWLDSDVKKVGRFNKRHHYCFKFRVCSLTDSFKFFNILQIVKSMVSMDFKTAADALEDRKYVV